MLPVIICNTSAQIISDTRITEVVLFWRLITYKVTESEMEHGKCCNHGDGYVK